MDPSDSGLISNYHGWQVGDFGHDAASRAPRGACGMLVDRNGPESKQPRRRCMIATPVTRRTREPTMFDASRVAVPTRLPKYPPAVNELAHLAEAAQWCYS